MRLLILLFAIVLVATPAAAKKVALVIGNSAYQFAGALPNPRGDAEAVAAELERLGFEVTRGLDLDRSGMADTMRRFGDSLSGADVALLFYAGHGLQVEGENYLIPVDAKLTAESDLHFQTVPLHLLLDQLERAPRTNLVFLDACRDNPLMQTLARAMGPSRSTASLSRGLARVDAGIGTLIAYATQPGNVALDGEGEHSPFATALLAHLDAPGLEVRQMLTRVRQDVIAATDGKQVPWDHSSLTGDFYFQQPVAKAEEPPRAEAAQGGGMAGPSEAMLGIQADIVFWQSVQESDDPAAYRLYLGRYPKGQFAPLAEFRLKQLASKPTPEAVPVKSDSEQVAALIPGPAEAAAPGAESSPPAAAEPPARPVYRYDGTYEYLEGDFRGSLEVRTGLDGKTFVSMETEAARNRNRSCVVNGIGVVADATLKVAIDRPGETVPVTVSLFDDAAFVEVGALASGRPGSDLLCLAGGRFAGNYIKTSDAVTLTEEDIRLVQQLLDNVGLDPGPADGKPGRRTRSAVKDFQRRIGVNQSGLITPLLIQQLSDAAARRG